jgi:hypothetical protein
MPLETDPICLLLDDDHDLVVPLQFARGTVAARQGMDTRLNLIRGEVFDNALAGTPWVENDTVTDDQAIIGQPFDADKIENEVRKVAASTPNISSKTLAVAITFDGDTRVASVEYTVDTIFGDTITGEIEEEI